MRCERLAKTRVFDDGAPIQHTSKGVGNSTTTPLPPVVLLGQHDSRKVSANRRTRDTKIGKAPGPSQVSRLTQSSRFSTNRVVRGVVLEGPSRAEPQSPGATGSGSASSVSSTASRFTLAHASCGRCPPTRRPACVSAASRSIRSRSARPARSRRTRRTGEAPGPRAGDVPFERVADAHRMFDGGHLPGKIVLTVRSLSAPRASRSVPDGSAGTTDRPGRRTDRDDGPTGTTDRPRCVRTKRPAVLRPP